MKTLGLLLVFGMLTSGAFAQTQKVGESINNEDKKESEINILHSLKFDYNQGDLVITGKENVLEALNKIDPVRKENIMNSILKRAESIDTYIHLTKVADWIQSIEKQEDVEFEFKGRGIYFEHTILNEYNKGKDYLETRICAEIVGLKDPLCSEMLSATSQLYSVSMSTDIIKDFLKTIPNFSYKNNTQEKFKNDVELNSVWGKRQAPKSKFNNV